MNRPIDCIGLISTTFCSNLFTKGAAVLFDGRQSIPAGAYTIPNDDVRLLAAKLVFEEAQETIRALGCIISQTNEGPLEVIPDDSWANRLWTDSNPGPMDTYERILVPIIDGACDTIYVATGVLAACGVPDQPHLAEVARANNSKFPNGVATINPKSGKYLKPPGWTPPRHELIRSQHIKSFNPQFLQTAIMSMNKEIK